ncbi:MAG: transglutaminase domain-containing protein [Candidatus Fermentithermobacillus carboniphilus]|uniref:Transglutaminase domain-containing protein n=1 Tax=Candidatus Fermentithermobacillus carboniphilus TaxID=3085328 RepID=A0AAT9LBS0_9FIRM|nr:MAG: transglutaminase domain-containing protein [Candidatus Fermentithermobacillus carboniphilus]
MQYRLVSRTLEIITKMDSSPLTVKRSLDRRFLGNCRDFSVFLCSVLREQGIPARARCGFGTYFRPGGFEDHWVCEYWNGERWVIVDAQIHGFQRKTLRIHFDFLDMPRGLYEQEPRLRVPPEMIVSG